jgi:rhodanese-related sulfurtransferase
VSPTTGAPTAPAATLTDANTTDATAPGAGTTDASTTGASTTGASRTGAVARRPDGARGIDRMLADARARLRRLDPSQVARAQRGDAVLVDIRPAGLRTVTGIIPGALVVERNYLEWRFDPSGDARLPIADSYDLLVIVYCAEGYTSSLAATALQDLGLHRATDLAGGIAAWQATGRPTVPEPGSS